MTWSRSGEAPLKQIAADFGTSQSCLANWLKAADVEDGKRSGVTREEPPSCVSCGGRRPIWRGTSTKNDLPAGLRPRRPNTPVRVPVAVTCRVRGFSTQAF